MRIGTLILIAMFLLLPLMSSPVAAAVHFKIGAATNNTSNGPIVSVMRTPGYYTPGNWSLSDDGSGTLIITCHCYMQDTTTSGPGSDHYIELVVWKLPPGSGPEYCDYLFANLPSGGQITPSPTPIWVTVPYTAGGGTEAFHVQVYAQCIDIASEQMAFNTWYWTVYV